MIPLKIIFYLGTFMSLYNVKAISNERIVTDLEMIEQNTGLPIEYWYNETDNTNLVSSSPGCPKSIDGLPWIYFGKPLSCYLAGTQGGCPIGHKLWLKKGSHIGICACECFVNGLITGSLDYDAMNRYKECRNSGPDVNPFGQVYDTLENICHEIYKQGPCAENELLVVNDMLDALDCLPICGEDLGVWKVLTENGCKRMVPKRQLAAARALTKNECEENLDFVYSDIMKKCILREIMVLY